MNEQTPLIETDDAREDRMAEFVELYSSYYPRLQYYIMALLPSANDAADVLQETSMVLWRKFDSFQSGTNFFAWACKIARLQAMKHRERQGRTARGFDLHLMKKLADEACDEVSVRGVPLQALETCIAKLSEVDSLLVRTRYQPGMTLKRLAENVGRSANSVCKSLGRIRRALMDCIERAMTHEARE